MARIIKVPGFTTTDAAAPNVADYLIPYGTIRHHSGTSYAGNAADSVITTGWPDLKGTAPLAVKRTPYVYKVSKPDGVMLTGTKMTGPASTHGFTGPSFQPGATTIAVAFASFNAVGADFPLFPRVQGRRLTWSRGDGGWTVATSGSVGVTPKITLPMTAIPDHGRCVMLLELGTNVYVSDVAARGSGSGVGVFEIRAWQRTLTATEKNWVFGAFADANGVARAV